MQAQILAPAAVLVVWTLIVLFMIPPTRFGAIAKLKDVPDQLKKTGVRGADVEGVIPDKANWPAHNHTHLHEQPTLFYALVAIIAIMGPEAFDVLLAWVYVGLRDRPLPVADTGQQSERAIPAVPRIDHRIANSGRESSDGDIAG